MGACVTMEADLPAEERQGRGGRDAQEGGVEEEEEEGGEEEEEKLPEERGRVTRRRLARRVLVEAVSSLLLLKRAEDITWLMKVGGLFMSIFIHVRKLVNSHPEELRSKSRVGFGHGRATLLLCCLLPRVGINDICGITWFLACPNPSRPLTSPHYAGSVTL